MKARFEKRGLRRKLRGYYTAWKRAKDCADVGDRAARLKGFVRISTAHAVVGTAVYVQSESGDEPGSAGLGNVFGIRSGDIWDLPHRGRVEVRRPWSKDEFLCECRLPGAVLGSYEIIDRSEFWSAAARQIKRGSGD